MAAHPMEPSGVAPGHLTGDDVDHPHDHALAPTEEASHRLSAVAGWAVSACAVHCVLLPFAGVLPLLGSGFFTSPWFEWTFVAFAGVVGGFGLWISYARVHGNVTPVLVFAGGLALLVATHALLEGYELLHALGAVAGAALILVAAHQNHGLVHACEACHPHPHGSAATERKA